MEKTKPLVIAAALTVLAVALIGVAYAQSVSAPSVSPNSAYSQTPWTSGPVQQPYGGYYQCPDGSYVYGTPQSVYPYQSGMGFGGFCR
jgi:hypothetical protein